MKLSIIVPFHKGIHFLEDCFASIRDQGLTNYETILVLDHVKDDLSGLLKEYQGINLKVIEVEETCSSKPAYEDDEIGKEFDEYSGVACARNAGMAAASGKYIYFLDSDDYILSGTLSALLREAEEKELDLVYGRRESTWFGRKVYLASILEKTNNLVSADPEFDSEHGEIDCQAILKSDLKILSDLKVIGDKNQIVLEEDIETFADAYYHLFVSRKGLRNISILGVLFRHSFLKDNQFVFDENLKYFSDCPFLVNALNQAKKCAYVENGLYVKRKHNDPVHFPALSQTAVTERFDEYITSYQQCKNYTESNEILKHFLEMKLIQYYLEIYAPRLRRSEKIHWRTTRFTILQSCMKEVDPRRVKALKGYNKKKVKALIAGNVAKARRLVSMNLGYKKLIKMKKNPKIFTYYLYHKYFSKMSLKENWVFCESFYGKGYSDSPKYIFEYLSKSYPGKYRFIWTLNHKTKLPYKATRVKRYSIRYAYYLARSKYNIFNVRQPEWYRKREGCIFLETWHGTPLKKLVFDQEEVLHASPLYKLQFYKQAKIWDYLVSANRFSTGAFRSAFLYGNEILEYGYPRNDILHSENKEELASEIRRKLNIPKNKKTILYAPTWRDDEYYGRGEYKFALKLDLHMLKKELGEEYVVLLRTHYFIADSLDVSGLEDFAINVSKYDDISELYLISDLLITDYSSVFFDYANLKRPILFYTYDLDKYRDMLRGFYMDIETEVPGPLLFTNEEVIEAIKDINTISYSYKDKYEEFYERFCSLEDGHASENIAKRVFGINS